MRLASAQVKEAILHADQDVRQFAVQYFSDAFSLDPEILPLVIQAIERHGPQEAFRAYSFMDELVQSDSTVDWLLGRIESDEFLTDEENDTFLDGCLRTLAATPPAVLRPRYDRIMSLAILDDETRRLIEETLEFAARSPDELWQELEAFCHEQDAHINDDNYVIPEDALLRMDHLADALGLDHNSLGERVLTILTRAEPVGYWLDGYASRAAGAMRLKSAAIPLVHRLQTDQDDWQTQECERALAKIGAEEIVGVLAAQFPASTFGYRLSVNYLLERMHTDQSVQAALDLVKIEDDVSLQCQLLEAALVNLSSDAIEPARQFILATPLDPDVLEVRSKLLTACKLLGATFAEFDAWQQEASNNEDFRRQWYNKRYLGVSRLNEQWGDEKSEIEEDSDDEDFAKPEPSLPHPDTFVRFEERVGRNDPCPCGSGKKFKKCCLKKRSGV